jgi:hypothetical protein
MGRWIDRQTDRPTHGWTDKWTDGQMDRWTDGQMNRWKDGHTDRPKTGETDTWTNVQTNTWKDGQTDRQTHGQKGYMISLFLHTRGFTFYQLTFSLLSYFAANWKSEIKKYRNVKAKQRIFYFSNKQKI